MKKIVIILVLVFTLSIGSFAQQGGGLFQKGSHTENNGIREGEIFSPVMPNAHGISHNFSGEGAPVTPVGSGIVVLLGLGTAYMMVKKHDEE